MTPLRKHSVLISSAGRRVQLTKSFQRALSDAGSSGIVVATDAGNLAPATYMADISGRVPYISNSEFIETTLQVCLENGVGLVIPTLDTELEKFAEAKEQFESQGVQISVSDLETIQIASDKLLTHAWLLANGFPTPGQYRTTSLGDEGLTLEGPIVLKPRRGSMSQGIEFLQSAAQVSPEILEDDSWVIEERIIGTEYTVSCFANISGECLFAVPRQRLEVRAGEVSKGVTVRHNELERLCFEVVNALPGAFGALNIQVIEDGNTRELFIIEINARFGGGDPLAWHAGANAPQWLVNNLLGLPNKSEILWRPGVTMLRFDDAVFIENSEMKS